MSYGKLKKLSIISMLLILVLIIFSPYLITFYIEYKYHQLIKFIENLTPGVKVNKLIQRGYLNNLLISKIRIDDGAWFYDPNLKSDSNLINYIPHKIITLHNQISYSPFKKKIITINTQVLTGLPKFIKNQQNFKIVTTIDFKGNIVAKINDLVIQHVFPGILNNLLSTEPGNIYLYNENNNLHLEFNWPKVLYQENQNKTEMQDLRVDLKVREYNDPKKLRIKFLTGLERLYIINQSKPVLKLANLSVEQKLSQNFSNNISFLKLNILNQKFGPLATKFKINNIGLFNLLENLPDFKKIKFPLNLALFSNYKLINFANSLLQYKPSISNDLLLYIGNQQMNLLCDFNIDSQNSDWLDLDDVLDSININLFAKIPKEVTVNLVANLLELRENRNYKNLKYLQKFELAKLKKQSMDKTALDDLALEKIKYLLNHNIIKEEDDSFVINLSIAEGTFYSRMNPFKIFSF